jgi:hypothetical protein
MSEMCGVDGVMPSAQTAKRRASRPGFLRLVAFRKLSQYTTRVTSMNSKMRIADPLATARLYLRLNPNQTENRALRELLKALIHFDGTLHASESLLFQGELGELTAALLDARCSNDGPLFA